MGSSATPRTRRVEVQNASGFHVRPATQVREKALAFGCEVSLTLVETPPAYRGSQIGMRADAKNIIEMICLTAPQGSRFELEAVGPDAERALEAIAALFDLGFELP